MIQEGDGGNEIYPDEQRGTPQQMLMKSSPPPHALKVTASSGGVEDGQLDFVVRANDKDSTGRHRHASGILLIGIQHAQLHGNVALLVGDDGVRQLLRREFRVGLGEIGWEPWQQEESKGVEKVQEKWKAWWTAVHKKDSR